ncbi:MAG TPA: glycosyltransferase [Candidatus Saccharimonadales bacterium]
MKDTPEESVRSRVIVFGTYDTKASPRVQVLIDGLKAHDIEVIECNVPLGINTAGRVAMLKQPWRLPLLAWRLASSWTRLIARARRMPHADMVLVGHLGLFDIRLARWLFRQAPIALDYMISGAGTAKDRGVKKGFKTKLITWLDQAALKRANIVIVDTDEHLAALPEEHKHKGLVIAVGAPLAWFDTDVSQTLTDVHSPLKVVFFGLFTPLQGTTVIAEALTKVTAPLEVTFIGGGQDEAAVREILQRPNDKVKITWVPWVDSAKLPAFVASHDVCLGIFGTTEKAQNVVPNKNYQGAAVGCVVVTSDTPPQRRILDGAALYAAPGDSDQLAKVLTSLAANPSEVLAGKQRAYKAAQAHFTPRQVIVPLIERIKRENKE